MRLCRAWGASNVDESMAGAVRHGHEAIVRLCREWGATDVNWAMAMAAGGGHEVIVRLCLEWGATSFNGAAKAADGGHKGIVRLCRKWGADGVNWAMAGAVKRACGVSHVGRKYQFCHGLRRGRGPRSNRAVVPRVGCYLCRWGYSRRRGRRPRSGCALSGALPKWLRLEWPSAGMGVSYSSACCSGSLDEMIIPMWIGL